MSKNKPPFFFSATQSVDNRLGDIFNFTWASYAGLRELWWQIRGFHAEHPELKPKSIEEKFVRRIPPPGGVDVKRMFLDRSWEQHEQEFCKQIIFEVCTLFEGWAERICEDVFTSSASAGNAKSLQFPTSTKNGQVLGVQKVVDHANTGRSNLMYNEFFPSISSSNLNSWSDLDDNLRAYRYFKECRNAMIHSGGEVSQKIIDARSELELAQASGVASFSGGFLITPQNVGEPINLEIRDVILFSTVVRRTIFTLDAALSVSNACELLLEEKLRDLIATASKWQQLPTEPSKLEQRCHRMLSACNVPEPVDIKNVMSWMRSKALI
ncbi:hypothetical protein [Sulfitobacter geojensis]|uniref:hypothetical protein n=1 Tax=Sulfitobacter geojensis TaxID=1342299 RepID=UPI00248FC52C|nr:hypothetical protein [Sulfitobacter geojensis]